MISASNLKFFFLPTFRKFLQKLYLTEHSRTHYGNFHRRFNALQGINPFGKLFFKRLNGELKFQPKHIEQSAFSASTSKVSIIYTATWAHINTHRQQSPPLPVAMHATLMNSGTGMKTLKNVHVQWKKRKKLQKRCLSAGNLWRIENFHSTALFCRIEFRISVFAYDGVFITMLLITSAKLEKKEKKIHRSVHMMEKIWNELEGITRSARIFIAKTWKLRGNNLRIGSLTRGSQATREKSKGF